MILLYCILGVIAWFVAFEICRRIMFLARGQKPEGFAFNFRFKKSQKPERNIQSRFLLSQPLQISVFETKNKRSFQRPFENADQIREIIEQLSWDDITHVSLTDQNDHYLEVSGSTIEGFSSGIYYDRTEVIIDKEPKSLAELCDIFDSYSRGKEVWLSKYKYS